MSFKPLRSIAALAALTLSVGLLALIGGAGSASAATDGLVNGSFSKSTTGWIVTPTKSGTLSLTSAGKVGNGLLVRKKVKSAVSVRTGSPIAMTGAVGDLYAVKGWVKPTRTGQKATVTLREYRGTTAVRAAVKTISLTKGVWASLTISLTRVATDTTFEVKYTLESGYSTDRLTLDEVTLTHTPTVTEPTPTEPTPTEPTPTEPSPTPTPTEPTPTEPTPTPTPEPVCFDQRGVPLCGPVVGSAYGSNTDPATFEAQINHKLGIRRTYYTGSQVDSGVKTAANDLANGRIPWVSFKLPYSWEQMAAGAGDAWAKGLATKMAALPGPVWLAFHHEPEGDGDITAWTKMQERLGPIIRANAPNAAFTVVLTGWHQLYGAAEYDLTSLWPNTKVDIAGFDVYNSLGVVKDGVMNTKGTNLETAYFKAISEWAKSKGVAWGLAETGYTDYASELLPHWIDETVADMKAYGGVAFTYFNTTLNSIAPWTLGTPVKLADYATAQAKSPMLK